MKRDILLLTLILLSAFNAASLSAMNASDDAVARFDSTEIYKVKKISGIAGAGKYLARGIIGDEIYLDSVYAHIPDGQFVVNILNKGSLINRTASSVLTDTFYYAVNAAGDTLRNIYVYRGDTVEATPIHYAPADIKSDSTLGYKHLPDSLLKNRCFYFQYTSSDSLNGRMLGFNRDSKDCRVQLVSGYDTVKYFIEYVETKYATEAPAGVAALKKNFYRIRCEKDSTLYFGSNSPLYAGALVVGQFLFKEADSAGTYSFFATSLYFNNKYKVDPVDKSLIFTSLDSENTGSFRIADVEIPVYPDDEFHYLRYLPKGKGLYEIRSSFFTEERMLTKNLTHYAVFSKEGESILKSGSYVPADFHLWLDTARGTGSNRFRTSIYIIREATDTTGNVQGYFLHVTDPAAMETDANKYFEISGKKYSRANYVRAKRLDANRLQLYDSNQIAGDGALSDAVNEYRFYLQLADESDTTQFYIVTEKGYGGHRDSTGYLSYSFMSQKYFFGPREEAPQTQKLLVRLQKVNGAVANAVVRPPVQPGEAAGKEIAVTGEAGCISIQNAAGSQIQVYNIVGQKIADRSAASDNEKIAAPRGITIVKVGQSLTKKVVVK